MIKTTGSRVMMPRLEASRGSVSKASTTSLKDAIANRHTTNPFMSRVCVSCHSVVFLSPNRGEHNAPMTAGQRHLLQT